MDGYLRDGQRAKENRKEKDIISVAVNVNDNLSNEKENLNAFSLLLLLPLFSSTAGQRCDQLPKVHGLHPPFPVHHNQQTDDDRTWLFPHLI